MPPIPVTIRVDDGHTVSGLLMRPSDPFACLVLAHGAGAGMTHPFMVSVAEGLAARGMATLRYQFPFMESGSKRPDRPALAQATVRAAVAAAQERLPGPPLFAGGKSFGGRMTSLACLDAAPPDVIGLVFIGFPLHPAGKPSDARAAHLSDVRIPMLFSQGTRDALADPSILASVISRLAGTATVHLFDHADHSFHVPVRSGLTDKQVLDTMLDQLITWALAVCARTGR